MKIYLQLVHVSKIINKIYVSLRHLRREVHEALLKLLISRPNFGIQIALFLSFVLMIHIPDV